MVRDSSELIDAPWLHDPGTQAVCRALTDAGFRACFVGGCVRDALLGAPVSDVDIATDALPERVIELTTAAGLKPVPTGIDHGTITVVADGVGYEVTTFRRDVETDGRRAVVAFSTDLAEDARRRDFTMNALYADPDGRVIDPLGGLPDLHARRVRFIEDADRRIREDYLRALRYFRFHAWYGDDTRGMDADALAAIAANLAGLETLSAERIGAEITKLLTAPDPSTAMGAMGQTGVLQTLLPGADAKLALLVIDGEARLGLPPDWLLRLAALGGQDVPDRLRLSRADTKELAVLRAAISDGTSLLETAFAHGETAAIRQHLFSAALSEMPPDAAALNTIRHAARQRFPVAAQDLMPAFAGPALGAELSRLRAIWIASGFTLDRAALLDRSTK
ncbi:CCA tRNA nucleotidyltransferase [Sulfitobacter albidus]|uniref:CCA tRNA nucleotidyltransferase n=1 Tax=Sulfitobacter albidus TaxID=2829501 RepID=A0A975PLZ9_9RHOB|nr:CCA tRNA nucleotidyltransferase [Sulfitobacter albidus]QUJ76204.1 CCA tRNA nucleotidyltransferase [Sulfitobacter albidus]